MNKKREKFVIPGLSREDAAAITNQRKKVEPAVTPSSNPKQPPHKKNKKSKRNAGQFEGSYN